MSLIRFAARIKARQTRGGSWIQFVFNIGVITANIALFQEWFESFGLSLSTMLILAPIIYIVGTIVIGYIDEMYGIWQQENAYYSNLNPAWTNVQSKIEEMHKKQVDESK